MTPARSHEAFLRERAPPVEARAARLTRLSVERAKNPLAQIDLRQDQSKLTPRCTRINVMRIASRAAWRRL